MLIKPESKGVEHVKNVNFQEGLETILNSSGHRPERSEQVRSSFRALPTQIDQNVDVMSNFGNPPFGLPDQARLQVFGWSCIVRYMAENSPSYCHALQTWRVPYQDMLEARDPENHRLNVQPLCGLAGLAIVALSWPDPQPAGSLAFAVNK